MKPLFALMILVTVSLAAQTQSDTSRANARGLCQERLTTIGNSTQFELFRYLQAEKRAKIAPDPKIINLDVSAANYDATVAGNCSGEHWRKILATQAAIKAAAASESKR